MSDMTRSSRWFAMVQRELQEFRGQFIIAPIVVATVLAIIMFGSVLLANRIAMLGDALFQVILSEETAGMNITLNIDDEDGDGEESVRWTVVEELPVPEEPAISGAEPESVPQPDPHPEPDIVMEADPDPVDAKEWDFSRNWTFKPRTKRDSKAERDEPPVDSLDPFLNAVHIFMLFVLIIVTIGYLLDSFYRDRRDRSVLFWKSMPVSEWEEVFTKLAVAALVAPAVFLAVSLVLQIVIVLLSMLLVWRMDMDPFDVILSNVHFGRLLVDQVGGWFLTALWVAPFYAWMMLASAFAKRSPFLVAVTPVLALIFLEEIFIGSSYVASAVGSHIPHYVGGGSAVGFYLFGPDWGNLNFLSMVLGLIVAGLLLLGVVYLRRYRFER